MFGFVLGVIILFAIGSCTIKEQCKPDKDGNVYTFCNQIFTKEKKVK
jgi:hypothetical protein